MDFVKDHEELYNKTNENSKDKAARKELSVKVSRPGLSHRGHVTAN